MLAPEVLKSFSNHVDMDKVAYGVQSYYAHKGGEVGSYASQTYPGKGFKKNVEMGVDRYGRSVYDRWSPYSKGSSDYNTAVENLKGSKYGRRSLRRAGVIKREPLSGGYAKPAIAGAAVGGTVGAVAGAHGALRAAHRIYRKTGVLPMRAAGRVARRVGVGGAVLGAGIGLASRFISNRTA